MKNIKLTIKTMMASRGFTMEQLRKEFNERTGKNYVQQSFSYKINKETIKVSELIVICQILGYNLFIEDANTHERLPE